MNKWKPLMLQTSPYNPWYCTTKNIAAATTILWWYMGRRFNPKEPYEDQF